jgi:hypothetical protein
VGETRNLLHVVFTRKLCLRSPVWASTCTLLIVTKRALLHYRTLLSNGLKRRVSVPMGGNGARSAVAENVLFLRPRKRTRKHPRAILRTPLQQLAHFWRTNVVAVGPRMKISTCALLDEGRMTAIQVCRVWGKRVNQLGGEKKGFRWQNCRNAPGAYLA